MNRPLCRWLSVVCLAIFPAVGFGQTVLYSDNFETNSAASWNINASSAGNDAVFAYDYSAVGIPAAPGASTTLGLRLRSNIPPTGIQGGISVSPIGQSFTGDYTLRFHAWQNFNGAAGTASGATNAGGSGSTQLTGAGLGTTGTVSQYPGTSSVSGSVEGITFSASGEGGAAADYRVYTAAGSTNGLAPTTGVYAAGTGATAQSNADVYYTTRFAPVAAPAAMVALYPEQNGLTPAGTLGWAWHFWEISRAGNVVTWSVDGNTIATVDSATNPFTFTGNNFFLVQYDINATSSTDPNAATLAFGLFDNVQVVTPVPEPSSLALLALAAPVVYRIRRRRKPA